MAANYNADIRIGITGKTQLNALERQLGRINKDLNQINKNLKAQTLTINTKGATRALDQLDRKINKLNRSIKVNATINERRKGGGGGSATPFAIAVSPAAVTAGKQQKRIAEALTNEEQKRLDLGRERQRQIDRLKKGQQDILDSQKAINKLEGQKTKLEKSTNNRSAAAMFGGGTTRQQGLDKVNKSLKNANDLLKVQKGVQESIVEDTVAASRAAGQYNAKLREGVKQQEKAAAAAQKRASFSKKFGKGFGAGAGLAGASALGGIPVLGDAVTGGLVAGLSGASVAAGALGGAVVGVGVAFAGATANVTQFNNELLKQQRALANTVATTDELEGALSAVDRASQDFLVPIGEATQQFTKLNAAARASGFAVSEVEEVYRGLAAANTALGGDAQKLQGILLATQQVFSKGKVQAEELRGQIGERLPGAFALFAKAVGKTPAELDKALERGEVSLQDFVTFARSLLERYEDDAKKIADAPENAAARLKLAMDNLRKSMGPILTDLGNMFINLATTVVKQLTRMFDAINNARAAQALGGQRQAQAGFAEAAGNLKLQQDAFNQADDKSTDGAAYKRLRNATEGYEMATRALRQANQNVADTKLPFSATGKPLEEKLTPTPTNSTGGTGGSKSGPRDTTAELQAAIALQQTLLQIEKERFGLTERELELRSFDQQRLEVEANLKRELSDIQRDNITTESKALASTLAKLQAETDLQQIKNEQQQYEAAIAADIQQQITDLETQIKVEEAITDEMKEQAILAARIAEIQDGPGSKADQQRLIDAENRLQEARDGNQGVSGYMKQLKKELMDTEAMIVSLAQTVETELASAMSSAITGLIDGTKTAEEAFADMFKNIGKAFIDMATQMIAKALVMKALGILNGGNSDWSGAPQLSNIPRVGYAEGGFVTSPTQATIGDAGEPEYVIGASKMNSAMERYSSGMRGDAVISGAAEHGTEEGEYGSASGNAPINVNYSGPIMRMENDDYIKTSELPSIINQSAKAGEARALGRLRTSVGVRRKLGMS